jgi:hypothetical protein
VHTTRPIAFRATDLHIVAGDAGNARVVHSVPVAGASRITVDIGHTTAVGICSELGGLPAGAIVDARLTVGRYPELDL